MRFKEIISESTTTLKQMYQGDYPDRDEMFWDYVRPDEFDRDLEIQKLSPFKLKMMLTSHYQVEDLEELVDMIDEEDRLELLQRYQTDPNLSNRIIVVADGMIVDGNHRALAAALTNRPINYVDLADLEIDPEDEQLDEIKRLPASEYRGDESERVIPKTPLKPAPGDNHFLYYVEPFGRQLKIVIVESATDQPEADTVARPAVGTLRLYPSIFPAKNAFEVSSISVAPEFRGKGIAKLLYRISLKTLRHTLISGDSQTRGGQRNWVSLASNPEVEVVGFMKLTDSDLDENDQVIDKIMRMGSQFLGKDKYDDLYFAFSVKSTPGMRNMKADTEKAFKLYTDENEYQTVETGMYAKWRGA